MEGCFSHRCLLERNGGGGEGSERGSDVAVIANESSVEVFKTPENAAAALDWWELATRLHCGYLGAVHLHLTLCNHVPKEGHCGDMKFTLLCSDIICSQGGNGDPDVHAAHVHCGPGRRSECHQDIRKQTG